MNIGNLPFFALYKIYDNLDTNARKNLASVDKTTYQFFVTLKRQDDHSKKIANFILENYQIIDCSFQMSDLKKIMFHARRLILLGETHTHEVHRYLNAHFIRLIWNENCVIQIEGGEKTLEHEKKTQSHVFKYIPKECAETAESWDLPNTDDCWNIGLNLFYYSISIVSNIKKLLYLFHQDNTNFSLESLETYLKEHYSNIDAIIQTIPEINLLKEKRDYISELEKNSLINKIHKSLAIIVLNTIEAQWANLIKQNATLAELRNAHLALKVKNLIFLQGKTGIFLAGSEHVRDPYLISHAKDLNKLTGTPYFFLVPKEFITPDKIQKSFAKIFNKNDEISNSGLDVEEDTKQKTEEEAYRIIKDTVLNADVDKIDIDLNHFGMWVEMCKYILKYDAEHIGKE